MNKILCKPIPRLFYSYNKLTITSLCNNHLISGRYLPKELELYSVAKRFAGHSKWQNIKHTKLSKDAEKSKIISKLIRKLRYSLRNTGGADPKLNKEFRDVMELCRKANVTQATIDRTIKRVLDRKCIPLKMEIIGPNGCLLVLDAECEHMSALRYIVKSVLKKYVGFGIAEEGRAMFAFEEKGVVRVKNKDKSGQQIDLEKAEEVAIEGDAEEVKINPDNDSVLLFVSEPQNCHKTRKYIEENTNYEIIESGIELIPFSRVDIPEDTLQTIVNAIEELEELEEINRVYNNIK